MTTKYPRVVKINDPKLKKLIVQKNEFVQEGRRISKELDLVKEEQAKVEKKLIAEEGKVDVKEFTKLLTAQKEEVLRLMREAKGVEKKMIAHIKANTPQNLRDDYDALKKQEDEKVTALNKLGHQVQKVKDKIIPIVQKIGKPYLEDEWEDFSTTKLDDKGEPILEIYSRLEEWKSAQRNK